MSKLRVGILFGGRSGEHEVSLLSAASVLKAIDKNKYEVVPIGITKEGRWLTPAHAERLLRGETPHEESRRHLRAGDPQATPGRYRLRGRGRARLRRRHGQRRDEETVLLRGTAHCQTCDHSP